MDISKRDQITFLETFPDSLLYDISNPTGGFRGGFNPTTGLELASLTSSSLKEGR